MFHGHMLSGGGIAVDGALLCWFLSVSLLLPVGPLCPGSSVVPFRLVSFTRAVLLLQLNVRRTPAPAAETFSR